MEILSIERVPGHMQLWQATIRRGWLFRETATVYGGPHRKWRTLDGKLLYWSRGKSLMSSDDYLERAVREKVEVEEAIEQGKLLQDILLKDLLEGGGVR